MEESADFLQTVHASIDLFKNNRDLIPGTKDFDRRLADQFATMMTAVRGTGRWQAAGLLDPGAADHRQPAIAVRGCESHPSASARG